MAEPAAYLSNNPPDPIAELRERLEDSNRPLLERAAELQAAAGRIPEIDGDATAGKVADFIKLVSAAIKTSEAARAEAKEPHLAAGRAVDTFFKTRVSDPLEALKRGIERKLTAYLQAKEAERRRAAEEEARRVREEAEARARAAQEAEAKGRAHEAALAMDAAVAKEAEAQAAEAQAEAKPAELSRTRGEIGSVASLRQVWKGEVLDRAALDLEALRPYLPFAALETAINGFVKAGGRELKGARIFQHTAATVR
ncbi:MAG: hypothetical protein ING19_21145 [Azospirillum sp.]|nr:hypothetical protein [Azospirillum sp.]MCA3268559.1 hypothetical protein [Azospirillum sp.]